MDYDRPPAPMSIREAIEAAKILAPHLATLKAAPGSFQLIHHLFDALHEEHPAQVFRLLSLYYHTTLEALAESLRDKHPAQVVVALSNGMVSNPVPDLVNFGFSVGLLTEGWTEKANG